MRAHIGAPPTNGVTLEGAFPCDLAFHMPLYLSTGTSPLSLPPYSSHQQKRAPLDHSLLIVELTTKVLDYDILKMAGKQKAIKEMLNYWVLLGYNCLKMDRACVLASKHGPTWWWHIHDRFIVGYVSLSPSNLPKNSVLQILNTFFWHISANRVILPRRSTGCFSTIYLPFD